MNWLNELFTNPFLLTALSSWLLAQVLKTIIHAAVNKEFDLHRLFGDGGMPSGHSATVSSLAVITAFYYGTHSFEFAIALVLAIIVCHDAQGVRLETGKQAVVINELIQSFEALTKGNFSDIELKEFVGHTPLQVGAGVLLGIANACVMWNILR